MAEPIPPKLERPWLVTAWPGMGAVAHVAGKYLAQKLGAQRIAEVPADDFFDVGSVRVKDGMVELGDPPRERVLRLEEPRRRARSGALPG